jgi:hypothetical protein
MGGPGAWGDGTGSPPPLVGGFEAFRSRRQAFPEVAVEGEGQLPGNVGLALSVRPWPARFGVLAGGSSAPFVRPGHQRPSDAKCGRLRVD